ncbi:MAG: TonB-dependent receptor, partial [Muribaculaceae bacterium]|nr:TonB-dependent receptor [Muribaculaceae bacterium]
TNVGIDATLLNSRLTLSVDYFHKKTTDMLTIPPALSVAGENASIWLNTGSMRNNGWEVSVAYNSPLYGDFSWNGSINISQYKNKLLKLNNQQEFIGGNQRLVPGKPMGIYYGYVCDGIFQSDAEVANHAQQQGAAPGRLMYRDLNGDGVISDADRCFIGDPNPDLSMGINLGFRYKSFTLDMFFSGDFGFDIQNLMKGQLYSFGRANTNTNHAADILNAWTPTNKNTDIPALSLTDANNEARFSTYYVQDGSYMKMKYLKLGYTLPTSFTEKFACRSLDVFAQIENVFTMTKYKGLDPEILPGEYGAVIDNGAYPRPRTFTIGLNLQF